MPRRDGRGLPPHLPRLTGIVSCALASQVPQFRNLGDPPGPQVSNDYAKSISDRCLLGIAWFLTTFVVGAFDLGSFALVPLALVAPLPAVTLVSNVFFAHYINRERIHFHDLITVIILCCGIFLTTSYGPKVGAHAA